MALPTRLPRLLPAAALAVTAVLAAAGCTNADGATSDSAAAATTSAALTTAQAQQAFHRYVTTTATAAKANDGMLALSVVTGPQRAVVAAAIKTAGYTHRAVSLDPYVYGTPTFYLPEAGGYPRFFVASAARDFPGTDPGDTYATWVGSAEAPLNGTALLLFEQAGAGGSWQLASTTVLAFGAALPRLAANGDGAVPTVPLSATTLGATTLLAKPDVAGPLQAAVVDDGPASAASAAVAAGPLTTGMYRGARDHGLGLTPPKGDVYQWDLEGADYPSFTFKTADGAALVFYSMYLESVVATPSSVNKADPVKPGPRIAYPADLDPWIGAGHYRVSVQRQDLLTFAAVDPPAGTGKIAVIAIGGGVNFAAAS